MKRLITILVLFFSVLQVSQAQQDPMFTKYMFNTLTYNPAYTGSRGFLSFGALHRTQWWGIEGAPHSQNLWIHSPLKYENIGVGFNLVNDIIGPTRSIAANLNYAYHIPLGEKVGKLSIGLQGGITNWRADWSKLTYTDPNDESYMEDNPNYWLPNFGVGLYFYNQDKYYIGISVPNVIENDLRRGNVTTEMWAMQYRHYYFAAGGAIPLDANKNFVLKPMALVKTVGLLSSLKAQDSPFNNVSSPTEFDIDLSVLFYNTLWVGTSFRSSVERFVGNKSSFDSADIWISYFFKNGLRVGAAYDYTLTKLRQPAKGSFEVMLGYDFDTQKKCGVTTPRYF